MGGITQLEGEFLSWFQDTFVNGFLTPIMKLITFCAEDGIFWIALCLVLLIIKRTRRLGIICSISLAFTFLCCNLIIKPSVDRLRPWEIFEAVQPLLPDPGDASFPSGHSANAMAPAWAMFISTLPVKTSDEGVRLGWGEAEASRRVMHRFGIAAVILAMFIGISRLYLGMHFPTDVLCGLLLGMLCATVVYVVYKKIYDKRSRKEA